MKETAASYKRMTKRLRRRPSLANALIIANKVLTAIGYVAYPALLATAFFIDPIKLARLLIVPAIAFFAVSVFRYVYNEPRPYEALEIDPIIKKSTSGKSMPSRHTFCMFMIAFSWLEISPVVGVVLALSGCFMGVIRVLGGVHYPKDIIAGIVCAAAFAIIGYVLIPW